MSTLSAYPSRSPARMPFATESSDDGALLEAIALRQDREAFSILFDRYEKRAFNLAFYLTGNRTAAEDAAQEALMHLWFSASSHQPERGTGRAWIMGVVANKSLDWIRKKRRDRNHVEQEEPRSTAAPHPTPEAAAELEELHSALRRFLGQLPIPERQLVALYFGGGLSHEEIAASFSLPRPTVSFKIKKTLETLRTNLAQAGFAAAAPLLTDEGVGAALCSGLEAPSGLREKVMGRLDQATLGSNT